MNTTTGAYVHKLAPLHAESWQAWKLGERESDPLALDAPESLAEAVDQALLAIAWYPKDTLAVLYTHAGRNKRTLWLYTIKRSSKRSWRQSYDGGPPVPMFAQEAALTLQTEVAAFAPAERFDAFRDNAAGRDLTLIEAAPELTEGE